MEYIVILVSAISGMVIGLVFGFSMEGHTRIMEGRTFYPKNVLKRLFTTSAKDRSLSQNLLYFVLMVSWFFIFIGLIALPFKISQVVGSSEPLANIAAFILFALAVLVGKFVGGQLWHRYE